MFLRRVKIENADFYVKAILSIAATLKTCVRQSIGVSGFAAWRAFATVGPETLYPTLAKMAERALLSIESRTVARDEVGEGVLPE